MTETGRFKDQLTLGTVLENKSSVSGLDFKFSSQLEIPIKDNFQLQAMFYFVPKANLISTNSRFLNTRTYDSATNFGEYIEIDLFDFGLNKTEIIIPSIVSFGIGIGEERKWFSGIQYTLNAMNDFSHEFASLPEVDYQNAYQFSLEGFISQIIAQLLATGRGLSSEWVFDMS